MGDWRKWQVAIFGPTFNEKTRQYDWQQCLQKFHILTVQAWKSAINFLQDNAEKEEPVKFEYIYAESIYAAETFWFSILKWQKIKTTFEHH